MTKPMKGQIALVTGASRGIGYQCALAYARAGATVVAVARTVGGLEELDDEIAAVGGEAVLVPLDIRDGPGLDRLGPALAERFGRIDVLLSCAAELGAQTPIAHMSDKDWDSALATNLTANFKLLRGMDGLLRAAPAGRALVMTSRAALTTPAYISAYVVTKAGVDALVRTYARETEKSSVTANLIDPGAQRTHLRARYLPGEDGSTLPDPAEFAKTMVRVTDEARDRTGATWHQPSGKWRPQPPR